MGSGGGRGVEAAQRGAGSPLGCPWPVREAYGPLWPAVKQAFGRSSSHRPTEEVGRRDVPPGVESSAAEAGNPGQPGGRLGPTPRRQLAAQQTCSPVADYKCFNSSNVSIRPWSWNYRSCWHQTCPPVDTHDCLWIASIPSPIGIDCRRDCYCSSLPHRLSLHGAICVPAAHLGSGSRLSGSLSEIEP